MTARVCRSEPGRLARLRGFTLLELLVVLALRLPYIKRYFHRKKTS